MSKRIQSIKNNIEYKTLLRKTVSSMETKTDRLVYEQISARLVALIRNMPDTNYNFLTASPKDDVIKLLSKHNITEGISNIHRARFSRNIKTLWFNAFSLGIKHTVMDILVTTDLFKKEVSTLSNFGVLGAKEEEEVIAEFAAKDNLTPQQKAQITKAKRNLTILRNNIAKLKQSGVLYDSFNLDSSSDKAARLTLEQKLSFLTAVQEINDFTYKADASRKEFLADAYLQQRIRVLTTDYVDSKDTFIKNKIAEYLSTNIEGVKQIRDKNIDAAALTQRITTKLQSSDTTKDSSKSKADMIVRTELSIAYNFGKLSGFSSAQDNGRKFRWNADWELENRTTDYVVCKACEGMNGRIYTIRDLLLVGTVLDNGILRYEGKSRTDFKNPSRPMIPFHPFCSCFWSLEPEDIEEETKEISTDVNIPKTSPTLIDTQLNTLNITIGTGLIVGGAFLLARSNAWKAFGTAAKNIPSIDTSIVDQVTNVSKYVTDVIDTPSIVKRYTIILQSLINTNPAKLPKIPVV